MGPLIFVDNKLSTYFESPLLSNNTVDICEREKYFSLLDIYECFDNLITVWTLKIFPLVVKNEIVKLLFVLLFFNNGDRTKFKSRSGGSVFWT